MHNKRSQVVNHISVSGGFGFADVSEYAAASAQLGANALGQK